MFFAQKGKRHAKIVLIFFLVIAWVYSGVPQIQIPIAPTVTPEGNFFASLVFPPAPRYASAATTTVIITSSTAPSGSCGANCWTVPSDWDSSANRIEVIGGGAGGKNGANNGSGGGGGGAYSSAENVALTANVNVTFAIGAGGPEDTTGGDSYICSAVDGVNCVAITGSVVVVGAKGGVTPAGAGVSGGLGGDGTAGVAVGANPITYSGGDGGAGDTTGDVGGGGGGAAGPKGPGGVGESTDGTTGIDGGGGGGGGGDGAGNAAEAGGIDSDGWGGDGPGGTGGGDTATGNNAGAAGTAGTGGGGGGADGTGSPGGQGATGDGTASGSGWGAGVGAGGGGGGVQGNTTSIGGAGGNYGGGGGGGENGGGAGGGGIIVISYTPSANAAPAIDSITLDRTTVTPIENTYIWASTTVTITDTNGCSTITSVTAQFAAASSTGPPDGSTCEYNTNICYVPTNVEGCVATTTGDTCSDGTPNTGEWDCGFQVWYNAFPTDSSAPIPDPALQFWYISATTSDGVAASVSATNTTQTVDVATLNALDVSGNITYPETAPNADTGTNNQTVTVTNTGNTASDTEISGSWMCTDYATCAIPTERIDDSQQKFDISDVTYASLANNLSSTTPATVETVLATSTATTTAVTANTYWGIAIPNGQPGGSYTGENTFSAVAD